MIICENLSLLWESFLFMRISSYLWSSVGVFSFYENLFLFMIICKNLFCLWESLLFMRIFLNLFLFVIICENIFLFMINYFITYFSSHLPICAYLFSSSFIIQNLFSYVCIHLDQYWKSLWTYIINILFNWVMNTDNNIKLKFISDCMTLRPNG